MERGGERTVIVFRRNTEKDYREGLPGRIAGKRHMGMLNYSCKSICKINLQEEIFIKNPVVRGVGKELQQFGIRNFRTINIWFFVQAVDLNILNIQIEKLRQKFRITPTNEQYNRFIHFCSQLNE